MPESISATDRILAVVTLKDNKQYVGGGAPIFFVENEKELDKTSMLLARISLAMVHDLGRNIKIIVKH